ncbi:hypothetical protein TPL01_13400 [Sulfuriferula plumbiphila]|uniref:Ribose-5-phosphate isomerase n=1 Tax=Sulfuriferula plumbiphila TaxID=171865 RepID=A0A512L6X5_9PROT|nr:RpiB/LacA/LacB family sugar-phosphate isomerase [Sulfuriferula plumbiphila]BBP02931.1 hypothetical protein SFPGR_03530 [Sulfuriferula plumbiphila]GEP30202.1 hypothetical protein TPL01_13400 [Sulfuriferula plumbiphila]
MRVAIVNEISTIDKNPAIVAALSSSGHEIINAGMAPDRRPHDLTYIHTGLLSALLLDTGAAEFVVGGCGTGIGYLNSIMQYPGVVCGLVTNPLDSWLFARINGGNAAALQLNQGYGWAGEVNLSFLLEPLFGIDSREWGVGYPAHRRESQNASRACLRELSRISHMPMAEIVRRIPDDTMAPILTFPGIADLLDARQNARCETSRALHQKLVDYEYARSRPLIDSDGKDSRIRECMEQKVTKRALIS